MADFTFLKKINVYSTYTTFSPYMHTQLCNDTWDMWEDVLL